MNPLSILIAILKPLLYPLSLLYGVAIWIRNRLYNSGLLASVEFDLPVISVGNLSTGGTGKTPHIEYLIRLLQYEYQLATMSRGYKRETHGFLLAGPHTTSRDIGDEPLQYHLKYAEVAVSVAEDRMTGIPQLLARRPDVEVILLDDAFQHRSVRPGLNILITDFQRPFFKDFILPFGGLRESRHSYKRADVIIISKCPSQLDKEQQQSILGQIRPQAHQQVFFSRIQYSHFKDFFSGATVLLQKGSHIIMVSGIAKPEPMLDYLREQSHEVHLLRYPDHHYYTKNNLEEIKATFGNWEGNQKVIITTEKDAARLSLYRDLLLEWGLPVLVLPIEITFLQDSSVFDLLVKKYIAETIAERDGYDANHTGNLPDIEEHE